MVALFEKVFGAQLFLSTEAPFLADPLVQVLGKGLGKAVRQGLGHDGVVIVVRGFVSGDHFVQSEARAHREAADMVLGSLGSHKVGQRPLGCSVFFDHLLTQHVEGGLNAGAGFVGEDLHGVSVAIGRENSIHSAGSDALSGDQVIEQSLCIDEEFLGLFAILLML